MSIQLGASRPCEIMGPRGVDAEGQPTVAVVALRRGPGGPRSVDQQVAVVIGVGQDAIGVIDDDQVPHQVITKDPRGCSEPPSVLRAVCGSSITNCGSATSGVDRCVRIERTSRTVSQHHRQKLLASWTLVIKYCLGDTFAPLDREDAPLSMCLLKAVSALPEWFADRSGVGENIFVPEPLEQVVDIHQRTLNRNPASLSSKMLDDVRYWVPQPG